MAQPVYTLSGTITSSGFSSGHRFVIGDWVSGPLGAMVDIMWVDPDGTRRLVAANDEVAQLVSAIYRFDEVLVEPALTTSLRSGVLRVEARCLRLAFAFGRRLPIPFGRIRTPMVTRFVEQPIARRVMGVQTFGTTARGVLEWYQADSHRPVVDGTGTLDGCSLGALGPVDPPLRVGFSEPPRQPSRVEVRPRLQDPSGSLADLVRRLQLERQ